MALFPLQTVRVYVSYWEGMLWLAQHATTTTTGEGVFECPSSEELELRLSDWITQTLSKRYPAANLCSRTANSDDTDDANAVSSGVRLEIVFVGGATTPFPTSVRSRTPDGVVAYRRQCVRKTLGLWETENQEERLGKTWSSFACYVVLEELFSEGDNVIGSRASAATVEEEAFTAMPCRWARVARQRGDVTYALHQREMPVVLLDAGTVIKELFPSLSYCSSHTTPPASCHSADWSGTGAQHNHPPQDVVRASPPVLRQTPQEFYLLDGPMSSQEGVSPMLERVFSFLESFSSAPRAGSDPLKGSGEENTATEEAASSLPCVPPRGLLLGLELDELLLEPSQWSAGLRCFLVSLHEALSMEWNYFRSQNAVGETSTSTETETVEPPESSEVIFWSCRGYPVTLEMLQPEDLQPERETNCGATAFNSPRVYPPPASEPLELLQEKLLRFTRPAVRRSGCRSSSAAGVHVEDGPQANALLSVHPMLPAEVLVYQRYSHLRLLRHLYLFRGACVVQLGHLSSAARSLCHGHEAVLGPCAVWHQKGEPATALRRQLEENYRLEHLFLDVPPAEASVFLVEDHLEEADAPSWIRPFQSAETQATATHNEVTDSTKALWLPSWVPQLSRLRVPLSFSSSEPSAPASTIRTAAADVATLLFQNISRTRQKSVVEENK